MVQCLDMNVRRLDDKDNFTKSALNTQGIGLIMKKDFNGLRDLFSTKKKKKKTEMNKNR